MALPKALKRAGILLLVASVVSAQTPTSSPLLQGILGEDIAAVRVALDAGVNLNASDPQVGHSALHVAVAPGGPRNSDLVELLAQRGANLNLVDAQLQLTPLMAAMVVKDQGPFGVVERARAQHLVDQLLRLGANPDATVQGGQTALMFAAAMGNLGAVKALLASGAKPNRLNSQGATALHAAYPPGGSPAVIAALLAAGANPALRDGAGLRPGEVNLSPASTLAADSVAAPKPQDVPAPVPEKTSWNKWLIGGAVVAATVVGAVVLDALVKEQKKKNEQNAGGLQPAPNVVSGLLPVPVAPPVVACTAPQVLKNGACTTVAAAPPTVHIIPLIVMQWTRNGQLTILSGPKAGTYVGWSYRLSWCGAGSAPGCIDFKTIASFSPQDVLDDYEATKAIDQAARAMLDEVSKINAAVYRRGRPSYPSQAIFTGIIDSAIREGIAAKSVPAAVLAAKSRLSAAGYSVDLSAQ